MWYYSHQHWTNEETAAQRGLLICPLQSWQVPGLGRHSYVGFSVWGKCSEQRLCIFFDTGSYCSDTSSQHPALLWTEWWCCSVVFLGVSPTTEEMQSPGRVGVFIQLSSSVRKALSFCIDQAAVAAPGSVMREPPRGWRIKHLWIHDNINRGCIN